MGKDQRALGSMIGIAVLGGAVTGVAGLVVGIAAAIVGEPLGAGLALVAAAISFGLLANAMLRE